MRLGMRDNLSDHPQTPWQDKGGSGVAIIAEPDVVFVHFLLCMEIAPLSVYPVAKQEEALTAQCV